MENNSKDKKAIEETIKNSTELETDIEPNKDINKEKTETKKWIKKVPVITIGNFLLTILVVIIVATGFVVYCTLLLAKQDLNEYTTIVQNLVDKDNTSNNTETIKNMIDSALNLNTTTDTNTIDAAEVANRKVMNENLIVLYNGLILDTTEMGQTELKYIDNSDAYKDKYVITYYNYESFSFKESKLGILSTQVYDGLVKIDNVGKIAISESYTAIPRDIKIVNAIPTIVSEKNENIETYDSTKAIIVDLDGNATDEYVLILANKSTGYSKITLVDSTGTKVADLAYIEKSKWESVTTEEYYLSLSNVEILDIDNDGIMEILIELPKYEGDPAISLLRYKNGELQGETNIECSLLP